MPWKTIAYIIITAISLTICIINVKLYHDGKNKKIPFSFEFTVKRGEGNKVRNKIIEMFHETEYFKVNDLYQDNESYDFFVIDVICTIENSLTFRKEFDSMIDLSVIEGINVKYRTLVDVNYL